MTAFAARVASPDQSREEAEGATIIRHTDASMPLGSLPLKPLLVQTSLRK